MAKLVPVEALDGAAEMIEALTFENAELRADLEWFVTSGWGLTIDHRELVNDDYTKSIPCNGTMEDALRVIRAARKGE